MPVFDKNPAQYQFMKRHFPDFVEELAQDDPRADPNPKYHTMYSPVEYDMADNLIEYYGVQVEIIETMKKIDGGYICVYTLF